MNGISGKADSLAHTNLKSAELLADMQTRAKDDVSLGAQHLYVYDGDLAAQDGVAERIAANNAAIAKDGDAARPPVRRHGAADEFANYDQLRQQFVVGPERRHPALAQRDRAQRRRPRRLARLSSRSTVLEPRQPARERRQRAAAPPPTRLADKASAEAHATAASGKR